MARDASKKEKTTKVVYFIHRKMSNLKVEISEREKELDILQAMLDVINPCDKCCGVGEMRVRVAQDETEMQECEKCKGNGVLA